MTESARDAVPRRPALEPAFARAEEAYLRLRHQYDSGSLSADQFESAARSQMIDHGGRYWMIGVNSGNWYATDGADWREADAPIAATTPNGNSPSSALQNVISTPTAQKSKGLSDWIIMIIAFAIAALCFLRLAHFFFPLSFGSRISLISVAFAIVMLCRWYLSRRR